MLGILFLGTGASVPSRERSLPCVAVKCGSDITLFDCGEGAQRQLMVSPYSFMKVARIMITHLHGDHFFGLPGLLQTMGMSGRKEPLTVCGPEGISVALDSMLGACDGEIEYPLDVRELKGGERMEFGAFSVSAFATNHGIPSVGYVLRENDSPGHFNREKAAELGIAPGPDVNRLQRGESVHGVTSDMVFGPMRPGCSVVYSGDTTPCDSVINASLGADVLIHEATYSKADADLAKEHFHTTATDAAEIAAAAGVRKLMLVHVSNRYKDQSGILAEARSIFPATDIPADLQMYSVDRRSIRSA
jgi:ribonuclease Z